MNHEDLRYFHPLDKLGPEELEKLISQAEIREFSDSDYVFRLGEELHELLFVLDGAVRVMNIENRTDEQIARGDARARMPLTLNVPQAAVAIAVPPAKILSINFEKMKGLVSSSTGLADFQPGHEEIEEEPEALVESDEPEAIDTPDDFVLPDREMLKKVRKIELKPLKKQDVEESLYGGRKVKYSFLLDDLDDDEPKKEPEALLLESERRKESARRRREIYEKQFGITDDSEVVESDKVSVRNPDEGLDNNQADDQPAEEVAESQVDNDSSESESVDQESITIPLAQELHENIETQEYLRAMGLYKQGKWAEAQGVFRALLKANPATILYRQYLARCGKKLAA